MKHEICHRICFYLYTFFKYIYFASPAWVYNNSDISERNSKKTYKSNVDVVKKERSSMYGCITGRILLWQMILALLEMQAKCFSAKGDLPRNSSHANTIYLLISLGKVFFFAKGKIFFSWYNKQGIFTFPLWKLLIY